MAELVTVADLVTRGDLVAAGRLAGIAPQADWWLLAPGLIAVAAVSGWLAYVDWREHRLPNAIVGPLAAGVVVWLLALGVETGRFDQVASALGWGFAGFAVFFALHLTAGLGMGDVKYAWPVCATLGWFGWPSLRVALLALVVTGGIAGSVALWRGRGAAYRQAYGPFMALALLCGIVQGILAG